MAKKELSLTIRARNAMAAGLNKAKTSLQKFGQSAARIGKFFAKSFLAMGSAVVGFSAKAISAYSVQEKAEKSLVAALNAHGEAGQALLPMYKRFASAIQTQTGVADEQTLANMAQLRMLGVQQSEMERATKGVIALAKAGMNGATATRAMAAAVGGNYSMLTRYIPALRDVTDETEKANMLNDFLTKGYAAQREELDSVAGQYNLLKGRIGDLWEEMGRAIMENDTLRKGIEKAEQAVLKFTERLQSWIDSGGIVNLIAGFKIFYQEVKKRFELVSNSAHIVFASIGDGAESVMNYVKNVFTKNVDANIASLKYLADYATAIWNKIKSPMSKFDPPDYEPVIEAWKDYGDAIIGGTEAVTKRTEEALKERERIHRDHAKKLEDIAEKQAKDFKADQDERLKEAKEAAEAEEKLKKDTAKKTAKIEKKESDDTLKDKLRNIQKEKSEIQNLARSRVQAVIDARKAAKKEEEGMQEDRDRAQKLIEKKDRGIRLARKDKEFLEAFGEIWKAQQKAGKLDRAETAVKQQINEQQKLLKKTDETNSNLQNINKTLADNLAYSGG